MSADRSIKKSRVKLNTIYLYQLIYFLIMKSDQINVQTPKN